MVKRRGETAEQEHRIACQSCFLHLEAAAALLARQIAQLSSANLESRQTHSTDQPRAPFPSSTFTYIIRNASWIASHPFRQPHRTRHSSQRIRAGIALARSVQSHMVQPNHPTSEWSSLQDIFYRRTELYALNWGIDNLADYVVAAASNGGLIALVRDPTRLVSLGKASLLKPKILVYTAAGQLIESIPWDPSLRIIALDFNALEQLVVVLEEGSVRLYTLLSPAQLPSTLPLRLPPLASVPSPSKPRPTPTTPNTRSASKPPRPASSMLACGPAVWLLSLVHVASSSGASPASTSTQSKETMQEPSASAAEASMALCFLRSTTMLFRSPLRSCFRHSTSPIQTRRSRPRSLHLGQCFLPTSRNRGSPPS